MQQNAAGHTAVFCDGRNDKTRSCSKEHNVIVNLHPCNNYLGPFTCENGHTGRQVAESLKGVLMGRIVKLEDNSSHSTQAG